MTAVVIALATTVACNDLLDIERPTLDSRGSNASKAATATASDSATPSRCVEHSMRCEGQTLMVCRGGELQLEKHCPFVCADGMCSGECTPAGQQCDGNVLKRCDVEGEVVSTESCPGACDPATGCVACEPGSLRCDGARLEACDAEVFRGVADCSFSCDADCGGYPVGAWQVERDCTDDSWYASAELQRPPPQLSQGCSWRVRSSHTQYTGGIEVELDGHFQSGLKHSQNEHVLLDTLCVSGRDSLEAQCAQWNGLHAAGGGVELASCVVSGASCNCLSVSQGSPLTFEQAPSFCVQGDSLTLRAGERSLVRLRRQRSAAITITPPAPVPEQRFGQTLAATARWLAVGAPGSQQVFIHERLDNGKWQWSTTLTGDGSPLSVFGHAVAMDDNALAIGDPGTQQVCLFQHVDGRWVQKQVIKGQSSSMDAFGATLALNGVQLWIAAPQRQVTQTADGVPNTYAQAGVVYHYQRSGETWLGSGELSPAKADTHGLFGRSLVASGRWLAVGSRSEGGAEPRDSGSVHLYRLRDTEPELVQVLRPEFPTTGDDYGYSVALTNELLAVGAPGEDSTSEVASDNDVSTELNSGAVFVYALSDQGPSRLAFLKGPGAQAQTRFGSQLLLAGSTLVVGAPHARSLHSLSSQDEGLEGPGAAHWFAKTATKFFLIQTISAEAPQDGDRFGASLAPAGPRLAVGAFGAIPSATADSSAYGEADAGSAEQPADPRSGLVLLVPRQ